jgi:hypothetical protein
LKIWVNAFIPGSVDGYTVDISQGQFTGSTAVPLPPIARLNPLNILKPLSAGYLTDQRSFDSDPSASVRMQSLAEFGRGLVGWQLNNGFVGEHRTSGTTEVDIDTGEFLDFANAAMFRCTFSGGSIPPPDPGAPFTQIFHLRASAFDPLVSAAADIDYIGSFTIATTPGSEGDVVQIDWTLSVDAFPAFEAYVERDGDVTALLTEPPPAGNTVEDLLGPAKRSFGGSVTLFPNIVVDGDN